MLNLRQTSEDDDTLASVGPLMANYKIAGNMGEPLVHGDLAEYLDDNLDIDPHVHGYVQGDTEDIPAREVPEIIEASPSMQVHEIEEVSASFVLARSTAFIISSHFQVSRDIQRV